MLFLNTHDSISLSIIKGSLTILQKMIRNWDQYYKKGLQEMQVIEKHIKCPDKNQSAKFRVKDILQNK